MIARHNVSLGPSLREWDGRLLYLTLGGGEPEIRAAPMITINKQTPTSLPAAVNPGESVRYYLLLSIEKKARTLLLLKSVGEQEENEKWIWKKKDPARCRVPDSWLGHLGDASAAMLAGEQWLCLLGRGVSDGSLIGSRKDSGRAGLGCDGRGWPRVFEAWLGDNLKRRMPEADCYGCCAYFTVR